MALTTSQRVFDEGFYSIDYDNIREISSFLREIAKDVEAEVIWLGPFFGA